MNMPVESLSRENVDANIFKILMSSYMIPVNMSRYNKDWKHCQFINNFFDISHSQTCINQKCSFRATQQITMCFFPVFVFADDECILVYLFDGKPTVHILFSLPKNFNLSLSSYPYYNSSVYPLQRKSIQQAYFFGCPCGVEFCGLPAF